MQPHLHGITVLFTPNPTFQEEGAGPGRLWLLAREDSHPGLQAVTILLRPDIIAKTGSHFF